MKYKKLLKKAAVSLLLAQSLIFTGFPFRQQILPGRVWSGRKVWKWKAQETLYQLCRRMR